MGDQPGVQQVPDVRGVAPARVGIVVGDEVAQGRRVAILRERLGLVDERADLLFRRARRAAAGAGDEDRERELTQAAPPTAAGRP
ncbi:MAG TPA: hypothetical protein VFR77_00250 [Steroidobacteraceae bacterium]|nr:hypothetical protein [Steroidobacteraceae bacterium]